MITDEYNLFSSVLLFKGVNIPCESCNGTARSQAISGEDNIFDKVKRIIYMIKIKEFKPYILSVVIIGLFIYFGIIGRCQMDKDIKSCNKFGTAEITGIATTSRFAQGTKFSFYVDNKKYTGVKSNRFYRKLVGYKAPVIYYCKNPWNHELLVEPKDFEKYGLTFPDSLNWILPLLK